MQTVLTTIAGTLRLHKITDPSWGLTLRQVVRELTCDDSRVTRFPGPNPVSLDTSHFKRLRSEPYYVCEKTDGIRYLMLCARVHDLNLVVVMDRTMTPYLLPLRRVPKALYQGTVLDGELAWNKAAERWEFLIFDAISVSGIPVLNSGLKDRLAATHKALGAYAPSSTDPVTLHLKTFVSCGAIGEVDAHMDAATRRYDVDGVILTPGLAPVVYGRHQGMFKLKFGNKHTVDFLVADDGLHLCVFNCGEHVPVGVLRGGHGTPGSIVECQLHGKATGSAAGSEWTRVSVRTDKSTANDMFTYEKTLLNMRENLGMDTLKHVFSSSSSSSSV